MGMPRGGRPSRRCLLVGLLVGAALPMALRAQDEDVLSAIPATPLTAVVELIAGLNLLSVPVQPLSTTSFNADSLCRAVDAGWVVRLTSRAESATTSISGVFQPFIPGMDLPAFPIRGNEAYLLHVSSARSWRVRGLPWSPSERVVGLSPRLVSVSTPPGTGTSGVSRLFDLTGARDGWLTQEDASGRSRFSLLSTVEVVTSAPLGVWLMGCDKPVATWPNTSNPPMPPLVTAPVEVVVAPGVTFTLAVDAVDPQGGLLSYAWSSTDGSDLLLRPSNRAVTGAASHTLGTHSARVRVTSSLGASTTTAVRVIVSDSMAADQLSLDASEPVTHAQGLRAVLSARLQTANGAAVPDGSTVVWRSSRGSVLPRASVTRAGLASTALEVCDFGEEDWRSGALVSALASTGRLRATTVVILLPSPASAQPGAPKSRGFDTEFAGAGFEPVHGLSFPSDTDRDGLPDGWESGHGMNPASPDTDGDGRPDPEELALRTDPCSAPSGAAGFDLDLDGISDDEEVRRGLDPLCEDSDGDRLSDAEETQWDTDPLRADTDGDGLTDGDEVLVYGSWPDASDSDQDGIPDGDEVRRHRTSPCSADTDRDAISDAEEIAAGLRPDVLDTDGDRLSDTFEYVDGGGNPVNPDSDGDGLGDGEEVWDYHTNPLAVDTDADGRADGDEVRGTPATDPLRDDSDGDGLSDGTELQLGTGPNSRDTDLDGHADGSEVLLGLNPRETDSDGDGVSDYEVVLNPFDSDTDGDGLADGVEWAGIIGLHSWGALVPDRDCDGLSDGEEAVYDTSRALYDTDGDGTGDGLEVALGRPPTVKDAGSTVPPSGGTATIETVRRVVKAGAREPLLTGEVVLASDWGVEFTVRNDLGDPGSGRLELSFQPSEPSTRTMVPGALTTSGVVHGTSRGTSRHFVSTLQCSPGTIRADLTSRGGGLLQRREVSLRRTGSVKRIRRSSARGVATTVFDPFVSPSAQPAQVSDRYLEFRVDNLNPEELGLHLWVDASASGFLTPWGEGELLSRTDTELLYRIPMTAHNIKVQLAFNQQAPAGGWPETVALHAELITLWPPGGRQVVLKGPRGPPVWKLPQDVVVRTQPSTGYRVTLDVAGAVGCPAGGREPELVAPPPWAKRKSGRPSTAGKEPGLSAELVRSVGQRAVSSAAFRLLVQDSTGQEQPYLPVRLVPRQLPDRNSGPVSARIVGEDRSTGIARTGADGTVQGVLYFSGRSDNATALMAELEVVLGAEAELPIVELRDLVLEHPAPMAERSLTGFSLRYAGNLTEGSRLCFKVPVVPETVLELLTNLFEPVFPQVAFPGLVEPPAKRLLDLPDIASRLLTMPSLRVYVPPDEPPLFGTRELRGRALSASLSAQWIENGIVSPSRLASEVLTWGQDTVAQLWNDGGREAVAVLAATAGLAATCYLAANWLVPVAAGASTAGRAVLCVGSATVLVPGSVWILQQAYQELAKALASQELEALTATSQGTHELVEAARENLQLLQNCLQISGAHGPSDLTELLEHPDLVPQVVTRFAGNLERAVAQAKVRFVGELALQAAAETRGILARQALLAESSEVETAVSFLADYAGTSPSAVSLARAALQVVELRERLEALLQAGEMSEYAKKCGGVHSAAADHLTRSVLKAVTTTDTLSVSTMALEAVARIVAHPQLPDGAPIARLILGNPAYREGRILTRLLEGLHGLTSAGDNYVRLFSSPGSKSLLKSLAGQDNAGRAWEVIRLAEAYPGAQFDVPIMIGTDRFQADIRLPWAFVEVKSGKINRDTMSTLTARPAAWREAGVASASDKFILDLLSGRHGLTEAQIGVLRASGWIVNLFE